MAEKQTGIIYVDTGSFFFWGGNNATVLKFDFPSTIVKDMEVLNKELLSTHIQSFISVHKLTPSKITIFLSNQILFIKDVPGIEEAQKEGHIKTFVENVPFEKVAYVTHHTDKTLRIVAANQDLFWEIKKAFEKLHFEVQVVVPCIFIEGLTIPANTVPDPQTVSYLASVADSLRQFNMIGQAPSQNPLQNIAATAASKEHPKRLPILLGILGVLIGVLIMVAIVMRL